MKNGNHDSPEKRISTLGHVIALSSCLVVLLALGQSPALATDKCGAVCDETWDSSGSPYVVTCDVTVAAGCSLTVDAGVTVRVQASYDITIDGTLDVNGADDNKVLLTSDAAVPAAGDWNGIRLQSSAVATIDEALIEYATNGIDLGGSSHLTSSAGLEVGPCSTQGVHQSASTMVDLIGTFVHHCGSGVSAAGGTTTLTDVALTDNSGYGVIIGNATATLTSVTANGNSGTGISVQSNASATLTDVTANGNSGSGVHITDGCTATLSHVTAQQNSGNGLTVTNVGYAAYDETVVDVSDCDFTQNMGDGVSIDGQVGGYGTVRKAPQVTISASTLHSNGGYDLLARDFSDAELHSVDANGNWWGTTDEATIRSRIYDHSNGVSSPVVEWCEYLDGPGGAIVSLDAYCSSGLICDDTVVWDQTDKPYRLYSTVVVCPTGVLQVEPGVTVRALPGAPVGIEVHGELQVNGLAGNEATFTSDAMTPAAGNWKGLVLQSSAVGTINHALIEYATNGIDLGGSSHLTSSAGLEVGPCSTQGVHQSASTMVDLIGTFVHHCGSGVSAAGGTTTLTDVALTDNSGYGVIIGNATATLTSVTANGNSGTGISVQSNASATLTDVTANGNSGSGVHITDGCTATLSHVTAQQNSGNGLTVTNVGYAAYDETVVDVSDCDFTQNMGDGVSIDGQVGGYGTVRKAPQVTISASTLHSNGGYDLLARDFSDAELHSVDANGNWWGTTDEATIRSRIYDHSNGVSSPVVEWCEYLDGPGGAIVSLDAYCSSGLICDDTVVWDQTDKPYRLYSTVVVCPTGVLQVEPGVTVRALPGAPVGIEVHGELQVNGLAGNEATFTSDAMTPAAGNWKGLVLQSSAVGTINHALIEYATNGIDLGGSSHLTSSAGLEVGPCSTQGVHQSASTMVDLIGTFVHHCGSGVSAAGGTTTLTDVALTDNSGYGVIIGNATATLTSVTANGNSGTGISVQSNASATLTDVTANGNSGTGISVQSNASATLTDVTANGNSGSGVHITDGCTATLSHVTAQQNSGNGLTVTNVGYAAYDETVVDVSDCDFTQNMGDGVSIDGQVGGYGTVRKAPQVTISASTLHSNGGYDLLARDFSDPDTDMVWTPDNWWGTTNYEAIAERIYDHADNPSISPRVLFHPFGASCDEAIAKDGDRDGHSDFADNCPETTNVSQTDQDGDGMGDACDPAPSTVPSSPCDGLNDVSDGYLDGDGDAWGDPCDFQPTQANCYPGAAEICDGRDNDGDGLFAHGELSDADLDGGLTCGDCDDAETEVNFCACESCINVREDDCDGLMDGADPECFENPYCVVVSAGTPEPGLHVKKAACGEATLSGPFDVIRGHISGLQYSSGSVDLGNVVCAGGGVTWDRVTDLTPDPNPACNDTVLYFAARNTGAADFGSAWPGGEPRDVMTPDPICP